MGHLSFKVFVVGCALVSGCNQKAGNEQQQLIAGTVTRDRTGDVPSDVLLKCEGVEESTMTVKGASVPEVKAAVYGFRLNEASGHIAEWIGGAFQPMCLNKPCLTSNGREYLVNETFDRKFASGQTQVGFDIFVFRRDTGSLKADRLLRVGTGKGENDLAFAQQTAFRGTCETIASSSALKPKF